jgi:small GTP-binding protein
VAIVGRPNVGKSTLFNRLVGRRRAIVDDTPGVTRDVREAPAQLGDLAFTLLDTAGWETTGGAGLEARMRRFTERAIEGSDVVLFLIDARSGVLPMDESFAGWLRKRKDKVILVANKCEGRAGQQGLAEAHGLGLGEPIPVSAEHAMGVEALVCAPECLEAGSKRKHNKIDASKLAGRLYTYLGGDRYALRIVRVPTPEQEQERARKSPTRSIGGLAQSRWSPGPQPVAQSGLRNQRKLVEAWSL